MPPSVSLTVLVSIAFDHNITLLDMLIHCIKPNIYYQLKTSLKKSVDCKRRCPQTKITINENHRGKYYLFNELLNACCVSSVYSLIQIRSLYAAKFTVIQHLYGMSHGNKHMNDVEHMFFFAKTTPFTNSPSVRTEWSNRLPWYNFVTCYIAPDCGESLYVFVSPVVFAVYNSHLRELKHSTLHTHTRKRW